MRGTNLAVNSDSSLSVTSPTGSGTVDVRVVAPLGTSAVSPADQYTFEDAPTVGSVSPGTGPAGGGTLVTITGTGFVQATSVHFGAVLSSSFTVVSPTTITATVPSGAANATVDVQVTTPVGTSSVSPADRFAYTSQPAVTGVAPLAGATAGGTTVTVTGSGFTGSTHVYFGGVPGTGLVVNSDSSITVVSPPGAGTADVTVVTPGGTSAIVPADQYVFEDTPVITSISPSSGLASGGTAVTVNGTGFDLASAVRVGGLAATSFTVVNPTTVTLTTPPGSGTVDVTVTTPLGPSATGHSDQFTYLSGSAAAWGDNSYGELGNGTSLSTGGSDGVVPADVPGVTATTQVAGGGASDFALTAAGNVYAWGDDSTGELGIGYANTTTPVTTPTEVVRPDRTGALSGIVQIAAGAASNYALTATGNVYAWGDNTTGELGTGNNISSSSPVLVGASGSPLSNIVAITAHGDFALALTATGNVYAWGDDGSGELGNNSTQNTNLPVEVQQPGGGGALSGIVQVAEGASTSYALNNFGQVYAWGDNSLRELGTGSAAAYSPVPEPVNGLPSVGQIAGGLFHALAVTQSGEVYGWGDNSAGELGTAPSSVPQSTPGLIPGLLNITQISAGLDYSMAVDSGGNLYTWGYNLDGELGDGSQNPPASPGPIVVSGIPPVLGIAGGWSQSMAVLG